MGLVEDLELKTNEIRSGTTSSSKHSITDDVCIGNFVELFLNSRFLGRKDEEYQRYAGYITSIKNEVIGISPTHPNNKMHRGVAEEHLDNSQVIVSIYASCVKKYRIIY